MKRRHFLRSFSCGTASVVVGRTLSRAQGTTTAKSDRLPYKIGIRQASLRNPKNPSQRMIANLDTFKVARDIPGITGVELQVTNGTPNMWDFSVARQYKTEANRWGLSVPATAGVWEHTRWGPHAGLDLAKSIRASEIVGASTMLVAFFGESAPDVTDEASYGPVVSALKEAASQAKEAGVVLGLENSLNPKENKDLIGMIDHSAVKVYYDPDNMYRFGHGDAAVPGIELLGGEQIAGVHMKNNGRLLQQKGRVDWAAAFRALTEIGYDGWLIFETQHESHEQCKEMTRRNIAYVKEHFCPPPG